MKNLPLSACAAIIGNLLLSAPAAAQGRGDHDTPATQSPSESGRWQYSAPDCRASDDGWVVCRDQDGYWQRDHYAPQFRDGRYGEEGSDYGYGYGYDYRYGNDNGGYGYSNDIVSPWSIVQDLRYQGFSYISQPALAGQFYQVKARDPNGHKVKLYIDAYSGRIVKVKEKG
jgi:hypothetical protein